MKLLRTGLLFLILSLFLCLGYLLYSRPISFPWSFKRESSFYTTLVESGESSILHSAEFRMKVLFPYDFIDKGDKVNWRLLQHYYNLNPNEYALKSSQSFYPDRSLPEDWKYASLYALCRESGIDPGEDRDFFVVISASVKAGIPFISENMKVQSTSETHEGREKIKLTLPVAKITDIIVEDRTEENNGFPEVPMSPAHWSRFISVLSPEISELAVREGILDLAQESASLLIRDLFEGAGIDLQEIDFSE